VKELAKIFLKLGSIGFGGPIALIGMMDSEFVQKRNRISPARFQQFVAVAKLFPGPLATLVAVRIGKELHGKRGALIAGFCIIFPAFLMVIALSLTLKKLELIGFLNQFWLGLSLGALAVATQATIQLSKPLFKSTLMTHEQIWLVLFATGILTFLFPRWEAAFIVGSGLMGLLHQQIQKARLREMGSFLILAVLFYSCFKASVFTFGSGIAIVPVLRTVFIDQHHWVSNEDFLKGLTLGQITPGPLVIVSTYLGFITASFAGATFATVGTFFPTFMFGMFVMPALESKILSSEKLKYFFAWLLPAVCGAIFGSLLRLMQFSVYVQSEFQYGRIALTAILLAIMLRFKLSAGKIFLIGGITAYLVH
jgi:chromate transporter